MKLSIPSVSELIIKSTETIKRFPLSILAAIVGTISGIWYSELSFSDQTNYEWLSDLILVSFLGVSFLVAIKMYCESREWDTLRTTLVGIFGVTLLILYYTLSSEYISSGADEFGYRFLLIALIAHLAVSFAPFIHSKNVEGFWEYNKTLFLTILTSALYSAVLFGGLSVALLSIDNLLGFDIKDERYFQLWIFMVGIFNTLFFLSRFPESAEIQQPNTDCPKTLKVFVQYVLIPLVTVYILILYSYLIKIIVQWELPNGWVVNLVLSFSIAGIFSLLLLHPIKDDVKNNWIRLYSKLYYFALVPLVILLFVSIGTRISEYGVTINRFLVATLAVWLAGIVVYFIFSKAKNIKVMPISLSLVALVITFGPMSAFSVSERSQIKRLDASLARHEMIDNQNLMLPSEKKVKVSEGREVSSIIDYLVDNHGLKSLQKYFNEDIHKQMKELESDRLVEETASEKITRFLGIRYVDDWETTEPNKIITNSFNYGLGNQNALIEISGYDVYLKNVKFWSSDTSFVPKNNPEWQVIYDYKNDILTILNLKSGKRIKTSFNKPVRKIKEKHPDKIRLPATVPPEDLVFITENTNLKTAILIDEIAGSLGNQVLLSLLQIDIYIKIKQ